MGIKALNIINGAARLGGILGAGQTLSAEDSDSALRVLNGILDQWSTERQMVSALSRITNSWAAGLDSKLIGITDPQPPGSIAVTRPIRIEQATAKIGANEYLLISLDEAGYARYLSKDSQSSPPSQFYYRATMPLGEIFLLPIPSINILLDIWFWIPFGNFAALSSEMDLPPTYEKLAKYSLAIEMSPEWTGRPASTAIYQIFTDTKSAIKRINAPVIRIPGENLARLSKNYGTYSGFDIYSGRFA